MTKKVRVDTSPEEIKKRQDESDLFNMRRAAQAVRAYKEEEKERISSEKLEVFNQSEIDPGTRKAPESWLDFEIADRYEIAKEIGAHPAQESLVLPPNTSVLAQTAFNNIKLSTDPQNIADVLVKFFDDFLQQDEPKRIELTQILMAVCKKLLLLFSESESKNYDNYYLAVERILGKIAVGSIIEEIYTEDYGRGAEPEKIIGIRNLLNGIPNQYRKLNPGKHHARKGDNFTVKTYDPNTKIWKNNIVPPKSASSNISSSPDTHNTSTQRTSSGRIVRKVEKLSADKFGPATMSYTSRAPVEVDNERSASKSRDTISPKNPDTVLNGRKIEVVNPNQIPKPSPKIQGPKQ